MTDITPVLTKIKKLLALATSSNPNEAASAAAKAQALLMQHNLTMSQVTTQEQASPYEQAFVKTGSRVWRQLLLGIVARNNFCEAVYDPATSQATLIGEKHNQEVVTYLYTYLVSQLEPMALAAYQQSGSAVHAKSWKDSFYVGAVKSIKERLEAQKSEMVAASNACRSLVVMKDAALKSALYKFCPHIRNAAPKRVRSSGFYEGVEAGKQVALKKSIE